MSANNNFPGGFDPEEIAKMLRRMFGDGADANSSDFAKAAGLPVDPQMLFGMFQNFSQAANNPAGENAIDWAQARNAALESAKQLSKISATESERVENAVTSSLTLATAWLDRTTDIGASAEAPKFIDRTKWITGSIDTWVEFASPVAESIAEALNQSLQEQLPPDLRELLAGSAGLFKRLGGSLFAMQLGHAVGQLSGEIFSGGDIGVPVLTGNSYAGGSFVAGNIAAYVADMEKAAPEMILYLTVRELAHARLFKHAKWLKAHLESAISDYARGIEIDTSHIESLAIEVDPQDPESINELLKSGALIPPKTELQEQAHARIGHLLALIEGWVDTVAAEATKDMPQAAALEEMLRRRRATGGPAEKVFASLVGLELRPRKLREAQQLWSKISELGGAGLRDSLWDHPDLLPTIAEVETPARLFERLGFAGDDDAAKEADDFDAQLRKLLEGGFDNPQTEK